MTVGDRVTDGERENGTVKSESLRPNRGKWQRTRECGNGSICEREPGYENGCEKARTFPNSMRRDRKADEWNGENHEWEDASVGDSRERERERETKTKMPEGAEEGEIA